MIFSKSNVLFHRLLLLVLLAFLGCKQQFGEALNCKTYSPVDARFAAENFHKIQLNYEKKRYIIDNFVQSIRKQISNSENADALDSYTIEKNARKKITMATDLCDRLKWDEKRRMVAYIPCVQFLLYHHMQKLVVRLEHNWGISDEGNELANIYSNQKIAAWKIVEEKYQTGVITLLNDFPKINHKFDFCLAISGETHLKCEPISMESAEQFVKYFHRYKLYEPEFEKSRAKQSHQIATNIFNAFKTDWRKGQAEEEEKGDDEMSSSSNRERKLAAKNWKLAEPSMQVRIQVLINTAEQKCRQLSEYAFLKKMVESYQKTKKFVVNSTDNVMKSIFSPRGSSSAGTPSKNANSSKHKKDANDEEEELLVISLDKINSKFVTCIYHYMYGFAQNLAQQTSLKNDIKLNKIYAEKREKTRKQLASVFYEAGVQKLDEWIDGKKQDTPVNGLDDQVTGAQQKSAVEKQLPADDSKVPSTDPFKNCANVVEKQAENAALLEHVTKSFDEHLLPCVSQFIDAVANDLFEYNLFVNATTMNLDILMQFPKSMREKKATKNDNSMKDECFMMRELLASLNQSIAHRLNFEQITKREDKYRVAQLYGEWENLLLKQIDANWFHRIGAKISKNNISIARAFRKWYAKGTLMHPVRDGYREMREGMSQRMDDWGVTSACQTMGEGVLQRMDDWGVTGACQTMGDCMAQKGRKFFDGTKVVCQPVGTSAKAAYKYMRELMMGWTKSEGTKQIRAKIGNLIEYLKMNGQYSLMEKLQQEKERRLSESSDDEEDEEDDNEESNELTNAQESNELTNAPADEKKRRQTLSDLLEKEKENEETMEETGKENDENEGELQKIVQQIEDDPLSKRLNAYAILFRANYIALALELYERFDGFDEKTNWQYIFEPNAQQEAAQQHQSAKDRKNIKKIDQELEIFNQIVIKMGKKRDDVRNFIGQKMKKKNANAVPFADSDVGTKEGNVASENVDKEDIGLGVELGHMGYLREKNGAELRQTLSDEMKLNLEHFNLSFSGQCDISDGDLSDCFIAFDGLDIDAQLEKVSLLGRRIAGGIDDAIGDLGKKFGISDDKELLNAKKVAKLTSLQRFADVTYKKFTRWTYKFGKKGREKKNFLVRAFYKQLGGTFEVMAEMLTGEVSPLELIIPFFFPLKQEIKKGRNFVVKKVVVKGSEKLCAVIVNMFARVNMLIHGNEDNIEDLDKKQKDSLKTVDFATLQREQSFDFQMGDELNGEVGKTINELSMEENSNKEPKQPFIKKVKKWTKIFVDVLVHFFTKKTENANVGEGSGNNPQNEQTKKSQRRKKRAGEKDNKLPKHSGGDDHKSTIKGGGQMSAFKKRHGMPGPSTVQTLIVDVKKLKGVFLAHVDLHLKWVHVSHNAMIFGKLSALKVTSGFLLVLYIATVTMFSMWLIRMTFLMASNHGEAAGYLVFCMGLCFMILGSLVFFA